MLRSMYSGISGMKVNQVKLDVIGNNISNVGTTAFKSSRARFSDMLRQNVSEAMSPSANQGGKNASQVGLGVQLASIDTVMTQGMMQPTGRNLDVAIDGDGFFMVSKGPEVFNGSLNINHAAGAHTLTPTGNSQNDIMYSRDGSFILDREGNLLTGDGFRVMGYSLTNDDNGMQATSQRPQPISAAGFDVRFGPGSQLNEYKVVLGEVGPGTVAACEVDKESKRLIVSGDFSSLGSVSTEQIQLAMNKGVTAAGISQEVFVSGKPMTISNLSTDKIIGGSDSTSPSSLSFSGCTVKFTEGSSLNGYIFELQHTVESLKNENGIDVDIKANIDENNKKIIVQANLVEQEKISGKDLQDIINSELEKVGIDQEVIMAGSITPLKGIKGEAKGGVNAVSPNTTIKGDGTIDPPLKLTLGKSSYFNGYKISYEVSDTMSKNVEVTAGPKNLKIKAKEGATISEVNSELKKELKKALGDSFDESLLTIEATGTNITKPNTGTFKHIEVDDKGVNPKAPGVVNICGIDIEMPQNSNYNDVKFEVGDINYSGTDPIEVKLGSTGKIEKIIINGNFLDPMGVSARSLEEKLNGAIKNALKLDDDGMQEYKIKLSGTGKINDQMMSNAIEGGEELKSPGKVNLFGMEVTLGPGGSLNNYTIQIGKITAGTKTEATIDSKNKTIVINADLVTNGATTGTSIQNALNKALRDSGINQGITISGNPVVISGTESDIVLGGTPVQSLGEDGVLNFVNGAGELKAYDSELKTLKIPDKVRMPGSNQELRVKTYSIDKNGIITGVLEDGRVAALGQIAMASFKNPEGLTSMGGNLYSGSVNSGEAIIKSGVGTLGEDNSKGYGDNLQGMLEMSNVDLAEQFTDMIVTTRAFQASGKMITTGDEVLQDIINLKR